MPFWERLARALGRGGAAERAVRVPIRFLGPGEALEDLEPFDPAGFAERLVGR